MDRVRIVTFSAGGRPQVVLDLNDGVTYAFLRDTLDFGAPQRNQSWSSSPLRYAGQRLAGESHSNATVEAEWYIGTGASADGALAALDTLFAQIESLAPGRYLEVRLQGATTSTYYEIRGPAPWDFMYRWIEFQGTKKLHIKAGWSIAPLGEGERMEVFDDFAVDSIADYTFDAGAGTLSVSGGQLVPSSTAEKRLHHSARGYTVADAQATLKFITGASASGTAQLVGTKVDFQNYLRAGVSGTNLVIEKVVAGTPTTLATGAIAPALTASTSYWVRMRQEGNLVTAELWRRKPVQLEPADFTVTHTLAGGDATAFGAGVAGGWGMRVVPAATDWRFDDFAIEPFVYIDTSSGADRAQYRALGSAIPGTAQRAKADVTAFSYKNYVSNPGFEVNTTGWGVAAIPAVIAAATSITRVTTQQFEGQASGQVVTPGTAPLEGAATQLASRTFIAGQTYKFKVRVRANSGTPALQIGLIDSVAVTQSSTVAVTGSTSWQTFEATFTPTVNVSSVYAFVRTASTLATTFQIDFAEVTGPDEAPAFGLLAWAARPPASSLGGSSAFGYLEAESAVASSGTWSNSASAVYRNGNASTWATGASAATQYREWTVDPSTLAADDLADTVDLEVWGRLELATTLSSPYAVLSAYPADGVGYGGTVYTTEWGSAGKLLMQPSTASNHRFVRLGTLSLPARSASLWRVRLALGVASGGSGNFTMDYVLLVPARRRAASPSAKVRGSGYPWFIRSTGATPKTVASDLSGRVVSPNGSTLTDTGLGGAPIELPTGAVDLVLKLSSSVPDDPTLGTYDDTAAPPAYGLKVSPVPRYVLPKGA